MKKNENEYDVAWKDILDTYLQAGIEYCLPQLSKLIDWSKGWVPLDKELAVITKGAKAGKRLADKLYKVYLKDGSEAWLLLHLEVQSGQEKAFPQRMFTYYYRIFDKYQHNIVSCAILSDGNPKWRPDCFEMAFLGTKLKFDFLTIKLTDFIARKAELEKSNNPFAAVILVHLEALKSVKDPDEQRKKIKIALTRRLYEIGMSKDEITNLYKFIDFMIGLPEELELEYWQAIYEIEESKNMNYVSPSFRAVERFVKKQGVKEGIEKGIEKGIKKGIKKGVEKGVKKVAKNLLKNHATVSYVAKNTGLSIAEIKELQSGTK